MLQIAGRKKRKKVSVLVAQKKLRVNQILWKSKPNQQQICSNGLDYGSNGHKIERKDGRIANVSIMKFFGSIENGAAKNS